MKMLEVENVSVAYGKSEVCFDVSFYVKEGEILCIMGRNGVGKTTIIKSIMGILPARKGKIKYRGKDITSLRPHQIAQLGVGYVPQGRMIFPDLTVEENLRGGSFVIGKGLQKVTEEVFDWFPVLKDRLSQKGGTLSGGEQQQLAIARCLVGNPDFVLLDEPSEGIQPTIVKRIREIIKQINKEKNITFILVEQNLKFCLDCGTRSYIMDNGSIQKESSMETIESDPLIKQHLTFKR